MMMLEYIVLYLVAVFISSVSQVLLKKSASEGHGTLAEEYSNPKVIAAYGLFLLATLATVFAYRVIPLSLGAVLETTGYIYVTLFSIVVFKESFGARKAFALGLIVIGIAISSLGSV